MKTRAQLRLVVAATEPGKEVELVIFREGSEKSLHVLLGEQGRATEAAATRESAGSERDLGIEVRDLSAEGLERFGPTQTQKKQRKEEDVWKTKLSHVEFFDATVGYVLQYPAGRELRSPGKYGSGLRRRLHQARPG